MLKHPDAMECAQHAGLADLLGSELQTLYGTVLTFQD